MSAPHMTFQTARELTRLLGLTITQRRIYGVEHARTSEARSALLSALPCDEKLRLFLQGGDLTWHGTPLRGNSTFDTVADALRRRDAVGIELNAAVDHSSLAGTVEWLIEGRGQYEFPGVRVLLGINPTGPDRHAEFTADFPEFKLPLLLYHEAAQSLGGAMASAQKGEVDLERVTATVRRVASAICEGGLQMLGPIHLLSGDTYTWQHSVNVFLITLNVLQHVARDPEELVTFGQAALLHDIGKTRVPSWILNKPGPLTSSEWVILRRHPEFGAEILAKLDGVDPLACEVAYCHHMMDDGLGYPEPVLGLKRGPVTSVVQVADMFEAMTAWRCYAEPMSFSEAIRCIRATPGMRTNAAGLTLLANSMSPAPPGAEILFVTGERGIVVNASTNDAGSPIRIRVTTDEAGYELPEPGTVEMNNDDPRIKKIVLHPGTLRGAAKAPASV